MLGKFGNFLQVFAPPSVIEETDRLKIHADIFPDLNLSSQHHGDLEGIRTKATEAARGRATAKNTVLH